MRENRDSCSRRGCAPWWLGGHLPCHPCLALMGDVWGRNAPPLGRPPKSGPACGRPTACKQRAHIQRGTAVQAVPLVVSQVRAPVDKNCSIRLLLPGAVAPCPDGQPGHRPLERPARTAAPLLRGWQAMRPEAGQSGGLSGLPVGAGAAALEPALQAGSTPYPGKGYGLQSPPFDRLPARPSGRARFRGRENTKAKAQGVIDIRLRQYIMN